MKRINNLPSRFKKSSAPQGPLHSRRWGNLFVYKKFSYTKRATHTHYGIFSRSDNGGKVPLQPVSFGVFWRRNVRNGVTMRREWMKLECTAELGYNEDEGTVT